MQDDGSEEPTPAQAPDTTSVTREPVAYETYADWYEFRNSPNTVYLEFTLGQPDGPPRRVAAIRMSPTFAKKLAILLKRHVRLHEQQYGIEIPLEPGQLGALGIDLERDWVFPPPEGVDDAGGSV